MSRQCVARRLKRWRPAPPIDHRSSCARRRQDRGRGRSTSGARTQTCRRLGGSVIAATRASGSGQGRDGRLTRRDETFLTPGRVGSGPAGQGNPYRLEARVRAHLRLSAAQPMPMHAAPGEDLRCSEPGQTPNYRHYWARFPESGLRLLRRQPVDNSSLGVNKLRLTSDAGPERTVSSLFFHAGDV